MRVNTLLLLLISKLLSPCLEKYTRGPELYGPAANGYGNLVYSGGRSKGYAFHSLLREPINQYPPVWQKRDQA